MSRAIAQFSLDGVKELNSLFKALPIEIRKDVINASASAGATLLKKETKKEIQARGLIKTGNYLRSIKTRKVRGYYGIYHVYSDAPHAHLIELGTVERVLKKPRFVRLGSNVVRIESTGIMPPNPVFRYIADNRKQEVIQAIARRYYKRLHAETKKLTQRYRTMSKSYRRKIAS